MELADFYAGLDSLFSQKNIAAAENYLACHLTAAKNCGNAAYQLAVLNEQIGYYRSLGQFPEAFTACEQAMAIIAGPDFTDSIAAATTMLNTATALHAGGRSSEALEMYGEVEKIYAATLADIDPRQAALYNNMAQAWAGSGDKKTAFAYLHKSLAILNTAQENCAELATTHSNIALLYMSFSNNEAAAVHLQAALSGFETLGYNDPHYPAALAAMAQLLYLQENYTGAVEQYRLALNKIEAVFGQNADYARTCRNCAHACSMAGMWVEAGELIQKAQAVESKLSTASMLSQESGQ